MNTTRRSEASLSTEEQLALAVEALSEHVVLFDAEDRVVLANKAWRELNKDVVEFTKPGTRFEDHLRACIEKGLLPEASGREEAWLSERMERHLNPSGPFEVARQNGRWIRVYEQRLPNNGIILIISDITESKKADQALRESEERFRAVVNNSPAKVHIKDAEGRYILINSLAEELYGVTDAEARGKTTHEVFPKQQADAFTAHDRGVLANGEAVEQEEVWDREDGRHTFLTVKFPILNHAGDVTGIGAIGTDISDRKRAEERLQKSEKDLQMRVAELEAAQRRLKDQEMNLISLAGDLRITRDEAESANRAKSEFLANMSHELRTPLNAIIGFSDMIRGQTYGPIDNPKYLEYVLDINESGTHLLALINDILDLSKIEAGEVMLHEEAVDVGEAVKSCLHLVKERAETAGVNLKSEIVDGLPPLYVDELKFKQILINLLSNAVKFTPASGSVDLRVEADEHEGYTFAVSDTGIGIARHDISKVLTPFVQVESTLNRKYEGTGLGLPLTKSLTELHGGSLDLQSEVGVGTTVTVRLPAERIVRRPGDTQTLAKAGKKPNSTSI